VVEHSIINFGLLIPQICIVSYFLIITYPGKQINYYVKVKKIMWHIMFDVLYLLRKKKFLQIF